MIRTLKIYAWIILVCCFSASFYLYDFIIRVMPGAMTEELMVHFHISTAGLGLLSGLFFFSYMLMQIPSGMLFDRFNPRVILSFAFLITSLSVLLFASTSNLCIANLCRIIMGLTSAFAFVGALIIGKHYCDKKYFAFYIGVVQCLGCLGALIGTAPITLLKHHTTWQSIIYGTGVVGILLSAATYLTLRRPITKAVTHQRKRHNLSVLMHKKTWIIASYGFCVWAPVNLLGSLWGIPMLQAIFGSNALQASQYISLIWVAVATGAIGLGYLSKHLSNRILMPLSACIGLFSALALQLMPQLIPSLLILCMLGIGFSGSSMIFTYALVTSNNPPNVHGTLIGFTNMMVILPGTTLLPLCGLLLKHLPTDVAITSHYTTNRYHLISALIILCFSIALGLSQWINRLCPSEDE